MKAYWLNKQGNKNLIVFFAGWSFDENPFKTLKFGENDVLFVYDYNDMSLPCEFDVFEKYENKTLIAWSMGVFIGYLLKDLFLNFDKKIAINGTINPVDNECGIPVKIFELTLKHAKKGLEGKFYQNVFLSEEDYNKYLENPVKRPIDDRVSELENLYSLIKNRSGAEYKHFYDFAMVSEGDKIIPSENQKECHKRCNTEVIILPYGHNPFYNFISWEDIIRCKQTAKQ